MTVDEQRTVGIEPLTFDQMLEQVKQEWEQSQKELKEVEILIRQSSAEVEKLAQRNTQVANKIHQMEGILETIPRQDIMEMYSAAQDAQMRLFMMRGQMEQLQGKQEFLERHIALRPGKRAPTPGPPDARWSGSIPDQPDAAGRDLRASVR
jgi:two-component system sensor histidine kinase DegS